MVNNEIRRIKAKLKLFEEEGFNWLMDDIFRQWEVKLGCNDSKEWVEEMKRKYLKHLEIHSPKDSKQGKLEL